MITPDNHTFSEYGLMHSERIGQYPVVNGKILMKSSGIAAEKAGLKVKWRDKPGWVDGALTSSKLYQEWFYKVNY